MRLLAIIAISLFFMTSCSPIKSNGKEQQHQMELTLQEVQTSLDDLRHDVHCLQAELQIVDGKIKHQDPSEESQTKQNFENLKDKLKSIESQLDNFEKKISLFDKKQTALIADLLQLSNHANETTTAFSQYKSRISEIEKNVTSQTRKMEEIAKLKGTLEMIATSIKDPSVYKVKQGDSLEKIAKANNITVDALKKYNRLENDLIVVGQELKIPR